MRRAFKTTTGAWLALAIGQLASPTASQAAPFQVNGQTYDIIAVTATFDGLKPLLERQVWWNDASLAVDFAAEVRDFFGIPNDDIYGPYFVFTEQSRFGPNFFTTASFQDASGGFFTEDFGEVINDYIGEKDRSYLFPIATPIAAIPLPTSGAIFLLGLGSIVGLRRRSPART